MSFVGIAINIWVATYGTGGAPIPAGALIDRAGDFIVDRNNMFIVNVSQG